jgi:hypothetical protein
LLTVLSFKLLILLNVNLHVLIGYIIIMLFHLTFSSRLALEPRMS